MLLKRRILPTEKFYIQKLINLSVFRLQQICCLTFLSAHTKPHNDLPTTHTLFPRTLQEILEFFHQLAPLLPPPCHFYLSSSSITMRYTQRPLQIKYLYRKHRKSDTHGFIVRTMKKTCTFSPNQNIHLSSLAAEGNVSRKFLKENDLQVF